MLTGLVLLALGQGCGESEVTTTTGAAAASGGATSNGTLTGGDAGTGGNAAGGNGAGGDGGGIAPVQVPWESNFNLPPQDDAGFSILTPSADSRIVYVSASAGDDGSGVVYAKSSPEVGADPLSPSGAVKAFKTIAQAFSQMRSGFPDWMLLKRGEIWTVSSRIDVKSGRSPSERSVIGAYGSAPDRPLVRTGTVNGLRFWKNIRYAAVVGVAFRAHERDPDDPAFIGFDNVASVSGFWSYADDNVAPNATILIEDSSFSFYSNNVVQGVSASEDIVVRRCQIANNYSTTTHAQGMYTKGASVLLEENVFDHNGWYKQSYVQLNDQAEGQATYYNHNTYFTNTRNTIFRRNVFLRASSIGSKFTANPPGMTDEVMVENLLLDNNLYVDGEVGVSAGGNTDNDDGYRWRNILLMHNVLLDIGRSRPTNRTLGWGMEVRDWDGGAVSYNYFGPYGNAQVTNIYALGLQGHTRGVDVIGNVMHGLDSTRYAVVIDGHPKEQIVFSQNQLQFGGSQMRLIDSEYLASGTFSDNTYYADNTSSPFRADGNGGDFAAWQAAVGDVGSSFESLSYDDPGRTVESYMASQGKEASLEAFITEAKAQSKQNWRPAYTAAAVNAYVRLGYVVSAP